MRDSVQRTDQQTPSRRWAAYVIIAAGCGLPAQAQEVVRDDVSAPETVEGLHGPIVVAFPEPEEEGDDEVGLLRDARKALERHQAVIADATLIVNLRTYVFLSDRDMDVAGRLGIPEKSQAWAAGGSIAAESGWAWERVAIGAEYYTSLPIAAPQGRAGTGLLKPVQDPISVFGQAYLRLKHGQQVVTLYRQKYSLPYINNKDSRMVPHTFEGYSIDGHWPYGRFVFGYIDKIKLRTQDNFISMSSAAGVPDSDEGLWMAGMRYDVLSGFWIGALGSIVPNVLQTIYSELDKTWHLGEWGLRFGAQFIDQRSAGHELLAGGSFDVQSGGVRLATSFRNVILTTAFNLNSDGGRVRNPFGGSPRFSSLILSDFILANQKTLRVGLSYNGSLIGIPGLSGFMNYARGVDAVNASTGAALPDQQEFDVTLDLRPKNGVLLGSWLRMRFAILDSGFDNPTTNVRATMYWGLPVI